MVDTFIAAPGISMAAVTAPADKWLIGDGNHPISGNENGFFANQGCGNYACGRNVVSTQKWEVPHNDGLVMGFVDGHVKWIKAQKAHEDFVNGACNPRS